MPVYEYRCNNCQRKVTFFVRSFTGGGDAPCPHCGSHDLTRLISTFAIVKSDMSIYEDILSDTDLVRGLEANDPASLAKWTRKMEGAMGGGTGPEYDDMLEQMERGEPGWAEKLGELQAPPSSEED